jgi:hypothetical protein
MKVHGWWEEKKEEEGDGKGQRGVETGLKSNNEIINEGIPVCLYHTLLIIKVSQKDHFFRVQLTPSFPPSPLSLFHHQDYYPECLQSLLIVNSNLIFRIFWNIIYPFIDERTRTKIFMLKNDEALLDHFHPHELPPDFAHLAAKE